MRTIKVNVQLNIRAECYEDAVELVEELFDEDNPSVLMPTSMKLVKILDG